jgi:hypothetical protein
MNRTAQTVRLVCDTAALQRSAPVHVHGEKCSLTRGEFLFDLIHTLGSSHYCGSIPGPTILSLCSQPFFNL